MSRPLVQAEVEREASLRSGEATAAATDERAPAIGDSSIAAGSDGPCAKRSMILSEATDCQ